MRVEDRLLRAGREQEDRRRTQFQAALSERRSGSAVRAVVDRLHQPPTFDSPQLLLLGAEKSKPITRSLAHERLSATGLKGHELSAQLSQDGLSPRPTLGAVTQVLAAVRRSRTPHGTSACSSGRCAGAEAADPPLPRTVRENGAAYRRQKQWLDARTARRELLAVETREAEQAAEVAERAPAVRATAMQWDRFVHRMFAWGAARHHRDTHAPAGPSVAGPAVPHVPLDQRRKFGRPVTDSELLRYLQRAERDAAL